MKFLVRCILDTNLPNVGRKYNLFATENIEHIY
jgi:hypothetical protein